MSISFLYRLRGLPWSLRGQEIIVYIMIIVWHPKRKSPEGMKKWQGASNVELFLTRMEYLKFVYILGNIFMMLFPV